MAFGARVLLAVLVVNLLVPLGLSAGLAAPVADDAVVICTANGVEVVRLAADGSRIPDETNDEGFCVLCLPLQGPGLDAPDLRDGLLAGADASHASMVPEGRCRLLPDPSANPAAPRAPPTDI